MKHIYIRAKTTPFNPRAGHWAYKEFDGQAFWLADFHSDNIADLDRHKDEYPYLLRISIHNSRTRILEIISAPAVDQIQSAEGGVELPHGNLKTELAELMSGISPHHHVRKAVLSLVELESGNNTIDIKNAMYMAAYFQQLLDYLSLDNQDLSLIKAILKIAERFQVKYQEDKKYQQYVCSHVEACIQLAQLALLSSESTSSLQS